MLFSCSSRGEHFGSVFLSFMQYLILTQVLFSFLPLHTHNTQKHRNTHPLHSAVRVGARDKNVFLTGRVSQLANTLKIKVSWNICGKALRVSQFRDISNRWCGIISDFWLEVGWPQDYHMCLDYQRNWKPVSGILLFWSLLMHYCDLLSSKWWSHSNTTLITNIVPTPTPQNPSTLAPQTQLCK